MDKKYYTPSIDEFYVGFEYEFKNPFSEKWHKTSVSSIVQVFDIYVAYPQPSDEVVKGEAKLFRVKHLDEDDILSLGWRTVDDIPTYAIDTEGETFYLCEDNGKWTIDDINTLLFTIKNKSELRRLMQQLGIKTK